MKWWTLLFAVAAFAQDFTEEEDVLVLTDANFEAALEKYSSGLMVKFYAPWCGHCKKLAPDYSKAARRLKGQDPPVTIGKLDATVATATAEKYGVKGYPTLKFFVNKQPIDFGGDRTELGIVNWINKKMGPPVQNFETYADLQDARKKIAVSIVFYGSKDLPQYAVYEQLCGKIDDYPCLHVDDAEALTGEEVTAGALVMYKDFDDPKLVFDGKFGEANILKWVNMKSVPSMSEFDGKLAGMIFTEGNPGLFLFRTASDSAYDKVLQKVAPEVSDKLFVTYSQITEGLGKRLGDFVGMTDDDLPSVWIIHPTAGQRDVKKYEMEGAITPENIKAFVQSYKEGKIAAKLKSQPIPSEPLENGVRILVGTNFKEVAFDEEKDVLVKFYAPWCGHCKKLAPEYEKAAQTLASIPSVVLAKVDSTANDIEEITVSGFPTLKFFPANSGGKVVDYGGSRDADGIVNWIKTNANKKFTIKEDL